MRTLYSLFIATCDIEIIRRKYHINTGKIIDLSTSFVFHALLR